VKVAPPATELPGEMLLSSSGAALIVKVAAFDTRVPYRAVMEAVPADAMSTAGTLAVSCPEFTTDVLSAVLFQ
jgi:hypothetical protein